MVTELLLSQGPHLYGTGSFWNVTFDSNAPDHATNISQIFLGMRIECAKCHNHPWEKWTQDDFYGFAAFFARVKIKEIHDDDENEHYYAEEGTVDESQDQEVVTPKYLDGGFEADEPEKDIRDSAGRLDDVAQESVLLARHCQPRCGSITWAAAWWRRWTIFASPIRRRIRRCSTHWPTIFQRTVTTAQH